MNIYVANIPSKASDADLKELFQRHGEVMSARIVIDKLTNRSRGFGFVEMPDGAGAKKAIENLNGSDFEGKRLVVNEARPKTDTRSSDYGNRGGGYGNRGGGSFSKQW